MSLPRLFTTPIVLPSALTLGLTVDLSGTGSATLNNSDVAYPTIPAGTYTLASFLARAEVLLRTWLADAAAADTAVAGPAALLVNFKIKVPDPLVVAVNGNPLTLEFTPTGFTVGGTAATVTAMHLINTGTLKWGSLLGFGQDNTTSFAATIGGGKATLIAFGQCRFLHVLERSDSDAGEVEILPSFHTRTLRDGKVRNYVYGSSRVERVIQLLTQDDGLLGPPIPRAVIVSLSGDRQSYVLQSTEEDGLAGVSGVWGTGTFTEGAYHRVGTTRWCSRLYTGDPTEAELLEAVPASVNPVAGQLLYQVSEAEAMLQEAIRTGYLLVHEPDDTTGTPLWFGQPYALRADGEGRFPQVRVGNFFDLFDLDLPLTRRDDPELTLI